MSERTYQVIIGVLVLVVLVGGWLVISRQGAMSSDKGAATSIATNGSSSAADDADTDLTPAADTGSSADVSSSGSNSQTWGGEAVSAVDQSAGLSVMVASATLTERGWVAVQDSKGWILGAARLEAGAHSDVEVPLLRATEAGESYKVLVYVDDGDNIFDLHKDVMVMGEGGVAFSATFIAK